MQRMQAVSIVLPYPIYKRFSGLSRRGAWGVGSAAEPQVFGQMQRGKGLVGQSDAALAEPHIYPSPARLRMLRYRF